MQREFYIAGLHCASCAASLEKSLREISGVETAVVNFEAKTVVVTGEADVQKLLEVVQHAGNAVEKTEASAASEATPQKTTGWFRSFFGPLLDFFKEEPIETTSEAPVEPRVENGLEVRDVYALGWKRKNILAFAVSAVTSSQSQKAIAIVNKAKEENVAIYTTTDFAEAGDEVRAVMKNKKVFLGSPAAMQREGFSLAGFEDALVETEQIKAQPFFLAVNNKVVGLITLSPGNAI